MVLSFYFIFLKGSKYEVFLKRNLNLLLLATGKMDLKYTEWWVQGGQWHFLFIIPVLFSKLLFFNGNLFTYLNNYISPLQRLLPVEWVGWGCKLVRAKQSFEISSISSLWLRATGYMGEQMETLSCARARSRTGCPHHSSLSFVNLLLGHLSGVWEIQAEGPTLSELRRLSACRCFCCSSLLWRFWFLSPNKYFNRSTIKKMLQAFTPCAKKWCVPQKPVYHTTVVVWKQVLWLPSPWAGRAWEVRA